MLYRYIYIDGLMGYIYLYIDIFNKKLQFAAYGQFVLVFCGVEVRGSGKQVLIYPVWLSDKRIVEKLEQIFRSFRVNKNSFILLPSL